MSLIANETLAFVDQYSLENELFDLDDDDQREEYDRMRKLLAKRAKQSKKERIPRESIIEVPKTACIIHCAVANNVVAVINNQNKLTVMDSNDTVKGGTWDIPQLLAAADDGAKRFFPGDRPAKLLMEPLGRQMVITFEKSSVVLHVVLKPLQQSTTTKEGSSKESSGGSKPTTHYFELRGGAGGTVGGGGGSGGVGAAVDKMGAAMENLLTLGSSGGSGGSQQAAVCCESIGWCPWNTFPGSSGPLVIGSRSGGQIWSARLEVSGVGEVKRIFVLPSERSPITTMHQDRSRDIAEQRFLTIYAATASTLYIFYGRGSPETLFQQTTPESISRSEFSKLGSVEDSVTIPRRIPDSETIAFAIQCPIAPGKSGPTRPISLQPCNSSGFTCFWYSHCAEQQGLGGQWMWTHKEGVSFGSLSPPGFPSTPTLNGTMTYSHLNEAHAEEIREQQQRSRGISTGSSTKQQDTKKPQLVYSSTLCGFCMYVSTDQGMTAIAHPALLPWRTRVSSNENANRRLTMTSLTGGGNNNNTNSNQFGAGNNNYFDEGFSSNTNNNNANSNSNQDLHNLMFGGGGNDNANDNANNDLFGSSNVNQQQQNNTNQQQSSSNKDPSTLFSPTPIYKQDIKERCFHFMTPGSNVKDNMRSGGAFGAIRDNMTGKVYIFNPLELFELHVPAMRRHMFPLFLEHMLHTAQLCTYRLRYPSVNNNNESNNSGNTSGTNNKNKSSSVGKGNESSFSSSKLQNTSTGTSSPRGNANAISSSNENNNNFQMSSGGGNNNNNTADFSTRLHAIRTCDHDCRVLQTKEKSRLGFEAGKSLSSRLRCYQPTGGGGAIDANIHTGKVDEDRLVVAEFLHTIHMCRTVVGNKMKKFSAVLSREASRCLSEMGAYSCCAPLLSEASTHISITEAFSLLSALPSISGLRNDELAVLERDRLLAYELYGRSAIHRMIDERTIIGQYTTEIYCLVHWLLLVMIERCRRAEIVEENTFGEQSDADIHEIQVAVQFCNEAASSAMEGARSAIRDMTSEQLPRMTVFNRFRARTQSMMRNSRASFLSPSIAPPSSSSQQQPGSPKQSKKTNFPDNYSSKIRGGASSSSSRNRASTFAAGSSSSGAGSNSSSGSLLRVLAQSLTAFIQHHLDAGNLSFVVVERAVLAAASPKLASLVFVIMREFGVVLRNLTARGNFTAAARVLSSYCLSAQSKQFWRLHSSTLMAHCPLDFLSADFVEAVTHMNFHPEDLVCMLAPAAYHVKYSGREEHTQMCRSVVAVLRAYLETGNPMHQSQTLEKQTVMMMCLHNADEELVDFISSTLETDHLDLSQEQIESRRSSFSGFALRQCAKIGRVAGVAEVLFRQGLWFDAIRLLVRSGQTENAKQYALKVPNSEEQHKCWFEIVHCSVEVDPLKGSHDALEMLKESEGVLSVYDVFPELSESVPMSALGNGLVKAVNEVAERMKQTQSDVETARTITQRERAQSDAVRHGTLSVGVDKTCDVCKGPLLGPSEELVFYPACGHGMHMMCSVASGDGSDGLLQARKNAVRERGGPRSLKSGCPLCSRDGILDFITAPIDLPPMHPARLFES